MNERAPPRAAPPTPLQTQAMLHLLRREATRAVDVGPMSSEEVLHLADALAGAKVRGWRGRRAQPPAVAPALKLAPRRGGH